MRLAGVLLHVDPGDPDALRRAVGQLDVEVTADADGQVVLADLVVLRHVRVEVVLPVEQRVRRDLAVERETDLHDPADRLGVRHRQRTGMTQAHRAGVASWARRRTRCGTRRTSWSACRARRGTRARSRSPIRPSRPSLPDPPSASAAARILVGCRCPAAHIRAPRRRGRASAPLYFVWGTTYLGIREANRVDPAVDRRRHTLPDRGRRAVRVRAGPERRAPLEHAMARRGRRGRVPALRRQRRRRLVGVPRHADGHRLAAHRAGAPVAGPVRPGPAARAPRSAGASWSDWSRASPARRCWSAPPPSHGDVPLGGMLVVVGRLARVGRRLALRAQRAVADGTPCSAAGCSSSRGRA